MRNDQKSIDELLSMAITIAVKLRMDAIRARSPNDRSIAKAIGCRTLKLRMSVKYLAVVSLDYLASVE